MCGNKHCVCSCMQTLQLQYIEVKSGETSLTLDYFNSFTAQMCVKCINNSGGELTLAVL